MVYAVIEPRGFGDYFFDGNYSKSWKKEAEHIFENALTIEERRALVSAFFTEDEIEYQELYFHDYFNSISRKFTQDLGPLEPIECPPAFDFDPSARTPKNPASLVELTSRLLIADAPLKALIERFEPGVHQFWPIKVTPRGKTVLGPYYGLRIGQFIDSFRPDQSDEGSWRRSACYMAKEETKAGMQALAMEATAYDGAHLWREVKLKTPNVFMSDELYQAIKDAGLRMPKIWKMKDV